MELTTIKTVDMLTKDSVSVITRQMLNMNGVQQQVGEIHRCGYVNSTSGRNELQTQEPADVTNAVLAMWGPTPTIQDPQIPTI